MDDRYLVELRLIKSSNFVSLGESETGVCSRTVIGPRFSRPRTFVEENEREEDSLTRRGTTEKDPELPSRKVGTGSGSEGRRSYTVLTGEMEGSDQVSRCEDKREEGN